MGKFSPGKYFRSLTLIYSSMIFGQVFFFLIAFYLRNEWLIHPEFSNLEVFKWIVPLFTGGSIYQSNIFFKRRIKKARQKPTFARKMDDYRIALLVRYALWEVPSLLAIAAYFLTGQWLYLSLSALVILVFLAHRPDIDRARRELDV